MRRLVGNVAEDLPVRSPSLRRRSSFESFGEDLPVRSPLLKRLAENLAEAAFGEEEEEAGAGASDAEVRQAAPDRSGSKKRVSVLALELQVHDKANQANNKGGQLVVIGRRQSSGEVGDSVERRGSLRRASLSAPPENRETLASLAASFHEVAVGIALQKSAALAAAEHGRAWDGREARQLVDPASTSPGKPVQALPALGSETGGSKEGVSEKRHSIQPVLHTPRLDANLAITPRLHAALAAADMADQVSPRKNHGGTRVRHSVATRHAGEPRKSLGLSSGFLPALGATQPP